MESRTYTGQNYDEILTENPKRAMFKVEFESEQYECRYSQRVPLVSIVDPWDVRVASVQEPSITPLLTRRGISVDGLDIEPSSSSGAQEVQSFDAGSVVSATSSPRTPRTPWPWYKPATSPTLVRSNGGGDRRPLPNDIRPQQFGWSTADVPIKSASSAREAKDVDEEQGDYRQSRERPSASADRENSGRVNEADNRNDILVTIENELKSNEAKNGIAATDTSTDPTQLSPAKLVEQLVRSRYNNYYNAAPVIRRKLLLLQRERPVLPSRSRSTSRTTGGNANQELLIDDYHPEDCSIRINSNTQDEKTHDHEESPYTSHRRRSLSMPTKLDDMEDLRIGNTKGISSKFTRRESDSSATFSNSGSTLNGSALGSETDDEGNEEESAKIPLQSKPKHSPTIVPPSNSRKLPDDHMDYANAQSTNSTITSVNSISSLLKEKLQWTLPQVLRNSRKQQNADYRLRGFVGFLFLCVVFLVGFAHVYYTQHVLQRAYFDKFRFNKNERLMSVFNGANVEVLAARLGVGIPGDSGVFSCLPEHQRPDKVCLEWLSHSRLYLGHQHRDSIDCYHVTWQALQPGVEPRDCFDWSPNRSHWYGAGQIQNMEYPLEEVQLEPSAFVTGDIRRHPFGNVLRRYLLNSKGASISVDPETPLYLSINHTRQKETKEMCLIAKHDAFAYINHLSPLPQLNYTICAADNMRSLHSAVAEKFLWDGLRPDELQAVHSLLSEPVWQIAPTNEADVYNYTEDVIALGFLRQGHVLLSEEWQPSSGDLVLDESRFRSMKDTIDVIHRRGFRIVLTLQPFISTESENFKDAVNERLLISERGSDPRIPALTRYRQVNSAGVLDITNNKSLPWLLGKLEPLMRKYQVDAFYLDLGTAQDMPHYYKCEQPLTNPDHYKSLFVNAILGSAVSVIGVSSAISRPRAPVFVSLPPFPSSWKAIKTVIPTVLSYGIIGYPFIMPGAVGGDVALPMSDNNPDNDFEVNLPDKELYIRWLQLSTFLPVIRFTHLPSKYSDEKVLEIAKSLTSLRQKIVTPLLKKYANITLDTGLPIIRPLWMLDPIDSACHLVVDEFSVGEELIVAPILHSGSRQREVYLPAGVWKDGIDKSLRKGSRWIHNYRVAQNEIAYFVKMPDDMRF
ncbi:hypothetical protein QAD02_024359 [Eretmocerus hayati]|uniref:Uncharacterized protein n=1 Tax=Eretmocerus hayati TaxID=131215 RepID=A0ACC2Q118_9HYME|nr:hypothetical protein QAD02_024359 [Eretmocerus hayati]